MSIDTSHNKRVYALAVAKAWTDEKFKERLLKNPKATLIKEGMENLEDVEVELVKSGNGFVVHALGAKQKLQLLLPPRPKDLDDETIEEWTPSRTGSWLPAGSCSSSSKR